MERIQLAMARLPNVLETNIVANLRTLEQKISDQGPRNQKVDPHLLRLALLEIVGTRKQIKEIRREDSSVGWYANARQKPKEIEKKLNIICPLYEKIAHGDFPNLIGDALEIVVFRCIQQLYSNDPRCSFLGSIEYNGPKDKYGRYKKHHPPTRFMEGDAHGPADFILTHPSAGPMLIECKNVREWIYPNDKKIKDLIKKCCATGATPCFIARRIHYATITNILEPAGILAHETYYQYYPDGEDDLLSQVSNKRLLGFTDVRSWNNPHPRTSKFFNQFLSNIGADMASRFRKNRGALREYAEGGIKRAELYRAIKSPAAQTTESEELPDGI